MDLVVVVQNTHNDTKELSGYAASAKTGRVFSQAVKVSGGSAAEMAAARKKLKSDHAAFIDQDKKILEFFHVSLKRVSLSDDDVGHMTAVEVDRLVDQGVLDRDALMEAAFFSGFERDELRGPSLYLAQLKAILKKNSNFPLGALASRGKTVCRLRGEIDPAELVDRKGFNAVLRDGTIIGEPVLTKK